MALTSVPFEANSRMSRLEKETFSRSGLKSIHIPWSVEVICKSCFSLRKSHESITFEANSRLSHLDDRAFYKSGLYSIRIPRLVEVTVNHVFVGGNHLSLSYSNQIRDWRA
jgi:hypothetical protein